MWVRNLVGGQPHVSLLPSELLHLIHDLASMCWVSLSGPLGPFPFVLAGSFGSMRHTSFTMWALEWAEDNSWSYWGCGLCYYNLEFLIIFGMWFLSLLITWDLIFPWSNLVFSISMMCSWQATSWSRILGWEFGPLEMCVVNATRDSHVMVGTHVTGDICYSQGSQVLRRHMLQVIWGTCVTHLP